MTTVDDARARSLRARSQRLHDRLGDPAALVRVRMEASLDPA